MPETNMNYPAIKRLKGNNCVGVKTYIGSVQYGNTQAVADDLSDSEKDKILDGMESELRQDLAPYA